MLHKFLQFDTKVNILRENKIGKATKLSIVCSTGFLCLKRHDFIADFDVSFASIHVHH